MIRRALFVIAALVALLSGGSFAYFYSQYRTAREEFVAFADAYNVRSVFDGGSRAYAAAMDKISTMKHEVLYDLANLYFREALSKGDVSMLMSSIEYYKESLRMKPDFFEAKRNLEIATKLYNRLPEEKGGGGSRVRGQGSNEEDQDKNQKKQPGLEPHEQRQP